MFSRPHALCHLITDTSGRKKAIFECMKEMEVKVQSTEDPAVLDHILTLLMQAFTSMDATSLDPDKNPIPFTVQDKFDPTQKIETQLRLENC